MKPRILLIVWIAAWLTLPAWAAPSDALLQQGEMDFDEMTAQLESLTKQEFLADMKRAFALVDQSPLAEDENALVPWTAAMQERLGEFTRQEMADEIVDGANDEMFRAVLIQLHEWMEDPEPADPRLYQMLLDGSQPEYLRTTLLLHLDFDTQEQRALLEQIRDTGPAEMAAFAEKIIGWNGAEAAYGGYRAAAPAGRTMGEEEKQPWNILLLSVIGLVLVFAARVGARRWKTAGFPVEEGE